MRGITIILNDESIHTGNNLDLVQEKKEIGKPTPQSFTVQIPGRNGLLNLTKGLTGKVAYYNRPMNFQYFGTGNRERLLYLDALISQYHGETIQIIDDDYPDYYYEGEASVETIFAPSGNYITIKIAVDAQPFRTSLVPTVIISNIVYAGEICIVNDGVPVVPEITISKDMTITYHDTKFPLTAGTYVDENFQLEKGSNIFKISGTGEISINYREEVI